ncbi:MAG: histidine kinase dimerization/phosphoacceptor domain -containing protein [bacterium]
MSRKDKTKEESIKEIENLRRQVAKLGKSKTQLKRTQEKERQYFESITFLTKTAMKFVEFPSKKDMYRFIGECLKKLVPYSMVFINSYDQTTGIICTRLALGIGTVSEKTLKLLGRHPVGMTFKISEEALLGLTSNKLSKVPGGLYALGLGEIPKPICAALEKLYHIKHIYSIGFTWQGRLYGNASFIMREEKKIKNQRVIEAFIKQASIALQRKQAEDQLKASVKEKEILLKEIHHRVKNNLQIISSLLNLQSECFEDEKYRQSYRESQDRIKSMVLIHDKLYQSKDLANINTSDYINGLSRHLFESYNVRSDFIALKTDIEDIAMNIDTAIPCGLIINELISNALKYAFVKGSNDKKAEVKIQLCRDKGDSIELIVSDNGVGFPKNLDFRNTKSLGLQLVCALVDQLNGNINLDRNKGTAFTIKFKLAE